MDESHPLFGKKKKRLHCPNPLFVQWLSEWKEDAKAKESKMQYVFSKALKSMQKYPLPLTSGKDCKILENIGDKICKMLDKKLADHIAEFGSSDVPIRVDPLPKSNLQTKKNPTSKKSSDSKTNVSLQTKATERPVHVLSDCEEDNHNPVSEANPAKRKRHQSSTKEYVPAYRSGPYALILTLYQNYQLPGQLGYMKKADLISKAQALCDKSLSVPEPDCRYTAWSSMGSLIKKGLVVKDGSPARYTITESGCELAHKLEVAEKKEGSSISPEIHSPPQLPTMDMCSKRVPDLPLEAACVSDPQVLSKQSFHFSYITDDGKETRVKDNAAVLIDDEISFGFLIKCCYEDLLKSEKKYKLDTSRSYDEKYIYAYIADSDASEYANPKSVPDKDPIADTGRVVTTTHRSNMAFSDVHYSAYYNPVSVKPLPISKVQSHKAEKVKLSCDERQENSEDLPSFLDTISSVQGAASTASYSSSVSSKINSTENSQESTTSVDTVSSARSLTKPDFVLHPGSFDIVLCVDNREYYGGASKPKTLLPDLIRNGVDCDLRELQIGDMLWIAREKTYVVPGQLSRPEGKELVLDFVIERKRMDDLVHSMTDGRFKEQKFRLKHSGLRKPIYLIEDHGSMQNFSVAEDTIKQAITNTQVIDGFQIKRTHDIKESVAYLTVMTRYLSSLYQNKTLYACCKDDLKEFESAFDVSDREQMLMTFREFNQSSVKTKAMTVKEMFARQLIQLHAMSAEKARAVVEKYPTPTHLLEAYNGCITEKEKELLISTVRCGKANRCLGPSQSKQLYQFYCTQHALT